VREAGRSFYPGLLDALDFIESARARAVAARQRGGSRPSPTG
jgi:hypothetical protein